MSAVATLLPRAPLTCCQRRAGAALAEPAGSAAAASKVTDTLDRFAARLH